MKSLKTIFKEKEVSYLGSICQSAKMMASFRNGTITYSLYLAPADMSGYNVCPNSKFCKAFCLNESGRGKVAALDSKAKGLDTTHSRVNVARIKKTKWFFEDKESFMEVLIHELKRYEAYAKSKNMEFSVRLNCTSDISPLDFTYKGKNILEIFPNIQFYDYTKVYSRISLLSDHPNYDLTYSFNGYNWNACVQYLKDTKGKVAVVFHGDKLPQYFNGYKVVSGNEYDMRYLDPNGCVIGLHYHPTANDYDKDGHYVKPNTPFVVMENDTRCSWAS